MTIRNANLWLQPDFSISATTFDVNVPQLAREPSFEKKK
jgi:hypothetical protein